MSTTSSANSTQATVDPFSAYGQPRQTDSAAVWAFVVALMGIMLPIFGPLGGLALGIASLRRIKAAPEPKPGGRKLAIAAIVVSLVCLVLALAGAAALLVFAV